MSSIRHQLAKFKNQIVTQDMVTPIEDRVYPTPRVVIKHAPQQIVESPKAYLPIACYCNARFLTYAAVGQARRMVKVLVRRKGRLYQGADACNLKTYN